MYEFFQKWQTVIVWALGVMGVFIMAFLYVRFPSRKEFNSYKSAAQQQVSDTQTNVQNQLSKHKTELHEQLGAHKSELQEQLAEVKRAVSDDVRELERRIEKMPTTDDLHDLELKIERLNTNIESVKPGLSNVQKLTDLLMENELREKRNGDS
ncbi:MULTISPECIES: DUF2730 family protein [unclassified Pseudoalteromonas]|uniref:DUF2730 family protein n=1 Tax=unclassified Pseudoalteromonas TaxID=194690 RepID=UPI001F2B9676|nr:MULTISPECIES: DUF2730 family protein [unclassified Pseudoalteromonas]MCF2829820.1 DUF2730 domain-containing protein [Pseudoalteromonas sp. OF5H-5]MCF2834589.1 DUF2730 domain-containing protein [Pseudoalteromonas sp. DL2-H6]MCF2927787.1 DUF2730 domain-containing protein [Pseudoalteromonas sp. DL2-H1]